MVEVLGKRVCNDSATIMGIYDPKVYEDFWFKGGMNGYAYPCPWDKKYPNWRNYFVLTLVFDEPVPRLSKEECAEFIKVPMEHLSDELYNRLIPREKVMTVPYEEVFPLDNSKAVG